MKKLVYLHIPKSGGSSQRTIFFNLYGKENVYWHGTKDKGVQESIDAALIVGGHRKIGYYEAGQDALYMSVVREPLDRVVSLFSYYMRPDLAADELAWFKERERQRDIWIKRGMDPDSILNSIDNSAQFRDQIRNEQCAYLSRYEPTFAGVLRTLEEHHFVIGDQGSSDKFNEYLSGLLDWGEVPRAEVNRSRPAENQALRNEKGLAEALDELVREDTRLYRFIRDEHHSLYSNIDPLDSSLDSLKVQQRFPGAGNVAVNVNVYTKGYIGVNSDGLVAGSLVLVNQSALTVDSNRYPDFSLEVLPFTSVGELIDVSPQISQPLELVIPPGGAIQCHLSFQLPEGLVADAHSIQVRAVLDPGSDMETRSPLLDGTALLIPVY